MTRVTPFHSRTAALCQGSRWEEWAGFLAATMYELDHLNEYNAIRMGCSLMDVSPLLKYDVRGRDAQAMLQRVVVRNLAKSRVGRGFYTTWCDDRGKVMDDGAVFHIGDDHFRMMTTIPNLDWLQDNAAGFDVEIEEVSEEYVGVSLQGPTSRELLQTLTKTDLSGLRFFHCTDIELAGAQAMISRTGYTGDLGYEIWVDAERAEPRWDALVEAGTPFGLTPTGMLAMDMARIEAGLLLIDVDYVPANKALIEDQKSSPFELGLGWTVKLDQGDFVGRRSLLEESRGRPGWRLMGLEIQWEALDKIYGEFGLPPQLPTAAWRKSAPG